MQRESMSYDIVIVGAGPAGLAAAIRAKQLANEQGQEISVCVLEKGSEVGAHIMSGAVFETRALDELLPNWKADGAPVTRQVVDEKFLFLTGKGGLSWPTSLLPGAMKNHGNYIVQLGNLVRWLGEQAEALGVEIYPGFAAAEIVYEEDGRIKGVATGDMGLTANGEQGPNYQPGMELHGRYTVFGEGCRGHLGKQLMDRFDLRRDAADQTYGIGLKELWEVDSPHYSAGTVTHTAGWPLDRATYGGSFVYHLDDNLVAVGFVVGLDYRNPYLSPYQEFQRFKTHPKIRPLLEGGRRIAYGARALNEGGFQCLPKLAFPGGVLVGCEAGTLNTPKIKGTHTAMKSGMLAAEAIAEALSAETPPAVLDSYETKFGNSWANDELRQARNFRPAFEYGAAQSTERQGSRRRASALLLSTVVHIGLLLLLALIGIQAHRPKDQISLSGSSENRSADRLETIQFEVTEPATEPTEMTFSETQYDMRPVADIGSTALSTGTTTPAPEISSAATSQASTATDFRFESSSPQIDTVLRRRGRRSSLCLSRRFVAKHARRVPLRARRIARLDRRTRRGPAVLRDLL